ncbi:phage major tail tube protein [Sulfitobacter sp. OXR-159]|uniref:phage major tail tube protein n=1 Tax=Sulfitobacter sp. OXR-159 TaxID=3100174 RepID=UPI002AC9313B|nr:phage major tail tube protein [Sulfitobacter sp. OXR-159]WPZ28983.1 phage major tail tube protein [Sulfitobacter sp. OXR-159]
MAARDILKNFNLFVDGRGYAGNVSEYTPPNLAVQTEDHRAGGMDAPIALDMGMEGLEASFVLTAYDFDVLSIWGVEEGRGVNFTARGSVESYDGTVKAAVHRLRGKVTRIERGTWTPGQPARLTITVRLDAYSEELGGRQIHDIDVPNMKRVINGVDQLEARRTALGM